MLLTREHYELMETFEREFKGEGRLDREESKELWANGRVYQNGDMNSLFLAFRRGYALGKFAARDE